ncbi:Gfo/Idh/MocA family protein [Azotobacter chroococcum]
MHTALSAKGFGDSGNARIKDASYPLRGRGVGHIGRFHAQKYAAATNAALVAVADRDRDRAAHVAAECACEAVTDYQALLGRVEAVSIAVPTAQHFEVARAFLEHGIHVLLEKPIASNLEEAAELNRIARRQDVVFRWDIWSASMRHSRNWPTGRWSRSSSRPIACRRTSPAPPTWTLCWIS